MDKKNRSACFSFCNTEAKKNGSAQFSSSRIHAHMHRKKYVRTNDVRVLSTQYSGSAFSETRSAYSETRSAYSETRSAFSETRSAFSETCVSFKQSANPDASARPELPPLAPPGRQKTPGRPVFCAPGEARETNFIEGNAILLEGNASFIEGNASPHKQRGVRLSHERSSAFAKISRPVWNMRKQENAMQKTVFSSTHPHSRRKKRNKSPTPAPP